MFSSSQIAGFPKLQYLKEKLSYFFILRVVRHLSKLKNDHVILVGCWHPCPGMPKVFWITKRQYFWKDLSDYIDILYKFRNWWKLRSIFVNFVGCCQACPGMPKVLKNKWPISLERDEFFCKQPNINENYQLIMSFLLAVVKHVWACTKFSKIKN